MSNFQYKFFLKNFAINNSSNNKKRVLLKKYIYIYVYLKPLIKSKYYLQKLLFLLIYYINFGWNESTEV